ncbi:MAG: selenocysteine-specific translation elongation factor, partial [Gemmatimonadota bacterium]|nr:selenocysteine-specific translation elongation factor [Gemmatimonadota bacterium]
MTRHVVIGTAGHVDHGKTALVRALTGVETDRLQEEQRRGITIELGFAPCNLDGVEAGIVDVPGHEDFVRTMVAGATGIDVALLVVAADESVMPQTIEHVAILDFLGVPVGVVAVTKADLVEPGWLDLVRSDVQERLADAHVSWTDVIAVSSVTGSGIPELRTALARAAARARVRREDDLFRLPVDRVFSVAGAGTVVTGTVSSGTVGVGGEVTVFPGGRRARVRGIQTHGSQREVAQPGRRTALALTGVEREAAARGSTVVRGAEWRETETIDAALTLLPTSPPVGQRSRVRVHVGTGEVLARVTPAGDVIPPGGTGTVRFRLEAPVVVRWGDRLVIRAYSPSTTIGGAVVADPWPAPRPRRPREAGPLLQPPGPRLAAACSRAGRHGLPIGDLPVRLGFAPNDVGGIVHDAAAETVPVGKRLFTRGVIDEATAAVREALSQHHRRHRLEPGMPMEQLRQIQPDAELVEAGLGMLVAAGTAAVEGNRARLAEHKPVPEAADAAAIEPVRNAVRGAGFEGVTLDDLGSGTGDLPMRAVVDFLERESAIVRVGRDRYLDAGIIQEIVRHAREALGA